MKKTKSIGSKKFWKILAILLMVFVGLAFTTAVVCYKAYDSRKVIVKPIQQVEENKELDQSYEAVRERVNGINENYGQEVKSTYYGQTSTMEKMMQQRMFFSNLKSVFIIILILLVILLILVKGFGLALFKHRTSPGNKDNTEKPKEKPEKKTSSTEEKEQVPISERPEKTEEPKETEPKEKETDEPPQDADDAEVAENCQLP